MKPAILVMGVSASGKSTIGEGLARQIGGVFVEGDDLHPPTNVAKMSRGEALTDADRWPWLDRIAEEVARLRGTEPVVFACSALKRSYRDRLRAGLTGLQIVYPDIPKPLALERITGRKGHFMPASLVDSQFATLEPPEPDEHAVRVSAHAKPEAIVASAAEALDL